MKFQLKNIIAILVIAFTFASCSNTEDTTTVNELDGITKFKEIVNATHTIELYAHMGYLEQGFNEISLRIKDNATGEYVKNASVSWLPLMHMTMMTHSCPKSEVEKVTTAGTVYEGNIVFQMAQNATEYWDLKIDYTINGTDYTATSVIDVPASTKQRVTTFTGSDDVKYILAYVEPHHPKVALNDITVAVYKMESMMSFPIVNNYKVKIDPRMPSMGNHGSPNNVDLTQSVVDQLYHGKLSLTMTGLWKINLQLLNASDVVLKGETVTDAVPASSIYFEIEF
jgi:PBP1b-binding outer membrane lipoprotein LpoB